MTPRTRRTPRARRLDLTGELTVNVAAEQHQRLAAFVTGGAPLEIGLSDVTEMDTAGLQLLLLACREAARLGVTLVIRDASPAVLETLAVAHLGTDLDDTGPHLEVPSDAHR